jgi:hypothetical protein
MTISHESQTPKPQSDLSVSVLAQIEKEHVGQIPKWKFLFEEYGVWTVWALSLLIGASAFSMLIFFSMHAGYALYEATHDSALRFFFEMIPYAWVITFVLMAILAHYNLRHTKKGYKYQVWQVLLSSIILSFIGGIVFHLIGMSFLIDTFIAKRIPLLPALQTAEARLWQDPFKGRMVGKLTDVLQPDVVVFTDTMGTNWELYTGELDPVDIDTLYSKERVRIVGIPATSTEARFYGCGVFHHMSGKNISVRELKIERKEFIRRMQAHSTKILGDIASGTVPQFIAKPTCASYAAVERVNRVRAR